MLGIPCTLSPISAQQWFVVYEIVMVTYCDPGAHAERSVIQTPANTLSCSSLPTDIAYVLYFFETSMIAAETQEYCIGSPKLDGESCSLGPFTGE